MVQTFDPQGGVVNSKQTFNENLNTGHGPGNGGPASSFLPNGLAAAGISGSGTNKDYLRNGVEIAYDNSKTQWVESRPAGIMEDISIAVTIDSSHFPTAISMEELQSLLAHAANPSVRPESVSIARTNLQSQVPLASATEPEAIQDFSWIYWAGGAIIVLFLVVLLLSFKRDGGGNDEDYEVTQRELQQLKEIANQQQMQLQANQQQTQMLIEAQQRALQSQEDTMPRQLAPAASTPLQETLDELKQMANEELTDDDLGMIKSWIESS
jgi:hypothetical protein